MQLCNANTTATASTSSTEDRTSRLSTRRAAQTDSPQNPDTDSDSEPKNVYWSPSKSRQSKIFDEYFEKNQYPSKIEMEQLAEKACVSLQCVQSNFHNRRKRAHKMVASGARKELPPQMKQLKKVMYDKSIFDKFFENIQFPSKAELEQLAEQTGVSIECVRSNFRNRRKRAHKMVASGARKELPTQMKRLQEVMADKSGETYNEKELTDLKEELNIDKRQLQVFLREQSFTSSHAISHRELMARTQYPSKKQLKEEAQKTKRTVAQVRKWFNWSRRDIQKAFLSRKRKDLPHQMKALHEKYLEKQYITQEELEELTRRLNMRPWSILGFFKTNRGLQRNAGAKVIAEKDVPTLNCKQCKNFVDDSEDETEDEDEEEMEDDFQPCSSSVGKRKTSSKSSHRFEDDAQFSDDEYEEEVDKNSSQQKRSPTAVTKTTPKSRKTVQEDESEDDDSEDEDEEDVDKNSQPCSSSSVLRNPRTATMSRQRIEEKEYESSDDDREPPRKKRAVGRRQLGMSREDEHEFDEMAEDWDLPSSNRRVGRSQCQTPDYDYSPPSPQRPFSDMQLRNTKTTATASTSSTGGLTSRTPTRRAAQIDSPQNPDTDSDFEPKNVYWTQSNSRQSKIFDEYFEENQYPSKEEMQELAEKARVSFQCVKGSFEYRRNRARKMVAIGARKELPTQMKHLKKVVYDKSVRYWSQSKLCHVEIFDKFFENIQFPSKAELEQLAEQTGVSIECVRRNFKTRRKRAHQMVASGERKELPTQMKLLQEVMADKSGKTYNEKELTDLKEELNIDKRQLQVFLREHSFSSSHTISHRELIARTQYPSKIQLKEEAQKTKRTVAQVRTWFNWSRRDIQKAFLSRKRKDLPHQMKALHEKYLEKQYITQEELEELSEKLNIEPDSILGFFKTSRGLQRRAGAKVIAEKDVPRLNCQKCKKHVDDSEDESDDEDEEEMEDSSGNRKTSSKSRHRSEDDGQYSDDEGDDISEDSEDEDEEDVDKSSQPCSSSSVLRNSRTATRSKQTIDESSDDDNEPPRKERAAERRQMGRIREHEDEFDEMAEDWEPRPPNRRSGRARGQTPDYAYNPPSPQRPSSEVHAHAHLVTKERSRSSLVSRRIEEDSVRSRSPMPLTVDTRSAPNGRLQRQLSAPRFRFPHPSRRGQTKRWRSRMVQAVESYSKKLIEKQLSIFMRKFQQYPGSSSFLNSRRQNEETTHKSRKRVEEDESEDEDSEDEDSLSRNRKTGCKSRLRIEEEEDESSDDDNEPPRKKRPVGRRQMRRIREDEDEFDEMAEDWELPLSNRTVGRSRDQTRDMGYDHRSRVTKEVSTPSSFSRRGEEERSGKSSRILSSMESNEWLRDVFSGLSETRVKIHGRKFKDVVLPFDHSVDWENWSSEQTVQVATQLLPPRAVEFFRKSGVHSKVLYLFTHEIPGFFEGLEEHNEDGHFTREMFNEFGDNIRKIDELMKEKAPGTSSRSQYVESSSPNGAFKAPSRPAPRNPPVSQNPLGPMRNWTDEQCLQLARQFVPKKTLAVFEKWGLERQKLPKIAEKDEESFEQLRALDVELNDKETLSWKMFDEFGEYIRDLQEMEWKLRDESSLPSRPPSTMSAAPVGFLKGLGEARVRVHGEQFRDVVLPFDHSVDWENWSSAQTVEVADQLFPPRAVEFFKKSGVHSTGLYIFIDEIPGLFEGLKHNEKGHFTREMFDEFGDNIRKINELMKEKAAGTSSSSRSGYVESSSSSSTASSSSSSPDEVFKAPSSSAAETPPVYVLHTTLVGLPGQKQKCPKFLQERRCKMCGPEFKDIPLPFNFSYVVDQWTDAHFLEFASQFVPKESLAVLKKWGLTRSTVCGFTNKNEGSFRKLKDLDMKINKKETFTRQMFEQFGFYIREIRKIEQKRRREDLPHSPASSIMSESLNFWKSKDRCTPPRRDEFKEEVIEQEEEEEERAPATVLFTPRKSRK